MKTEKSADGRKLTVYLKGEVDAAIAMDMEEELLELVPGVNDLTFDIAQLEYISSAGLRVLLGMQKTMKSQGEMKVINCNDDVMEIFRVTGFVRLLNIV